MTGKDALPWLIIVTLGATALAVNSAPQNLGPLKSALAACATPVNALQPNHMVMSTKSSSPSLTRSKLTKPARHYAKASAMKRSVKSRLNSIEREKRMSAASSVSTTLMASDRQNQLSELRFPTTILKKIEYDWQHWVELDPGVYVYGGAQFTLRNRARVRMSDGVINVVEL